MEKIGLHNYQAFLLDYAEDRLGSEQVKELLTFMGMHPDLKAEMEEMEFPSLNDFLQVAETFDGHEQLKKSAADWNDFRIIAYIENQLSGQEKLQLEKELAENIILLRLYNEYRQTILSPEVKYTMPEKIHLFRPTVDAEALVAYMDDELNVNERAQLQNLLDQNILLQKELKAYGQTRLVPDRHIVYENKENLKREARIVVLTNSSFWRYTSLAAAIALFIGLFFMFNPDEKGQDFADKQSKNQSVTGTANPSLPHIPKTSVNVAGVNDIKSQESSIQQSIVKPRPIAVHHQKQPDTTLLVSPDPVKQVVIYDTIIADPIVVHSVIPEQSEVIMRVPVNIQEEGDAPLAKDNALSPTDYISRKIKKEAWGEGSKEQQKKISTWDVLAFVANKLKKSGSKTTNARMEYNEDKGTTEYTLTLGKLSITRNRN